MNKISLVPLHHSTVGILEGLAFRFAHSANIEEVASASPYLQKRAEDQLVIIAVSAQRMPSTGTVGETTGQRLEVHSIYPLHLRYF